MVVAIVGLLLAFCVLAVAMLTRPPGSTLEAVSTRFAAGDIIDVALRDDVLTAKSAAGDAVVVAPVDPEALLRALGPGPVQGTVTITSGGTSQLTLVGMFVTAIAPFVVLGGGAWLLLTRLRFFRGSGLPG